MLMLSFPSPLRSTDFRLGAAGTWGRVGAMPQLATNPARPSFEKVYEAHAAFVWRSLKRLGVREADLEDVAQEAFVVVHRKLPQFEGRSSVKTWVFGICLRVASDYRKRAHVAREHLTDEVPDAAVPAAQGEVVARRQARALLDRVLDGLDADKRATFVMFELEQLPMAEIAEAMEVPLQTAYARLYAARKYVEQAVAAHGKEALA
jgi:RNA polymerase sigma-70 factor (ECF subfamily)